jgi:hypothetical protein
VQNYGADWLGSCKYAPGSRLAADDEPRWRPFFFNVCRILCCMHRLCVQFQWQSGTMHDLFALSQNTTSCFLSD